MQNLTIGELAKKTGVSNVSIRHYERLGLLAKILRKTSGYRLYSEDMVQRICFIKNAKAVGFSLEEIKELLSLQTRPKASSQQVKALVQTKLAAVQAKAVTLEKMAVGLKRLISYCDGKMPLSQCPILEALYGNFTADSEQ